MILHDIDCFYNRRAVETSKKMCIYSYSYVCVHIYIYIYIYIRGAFNKFPDIFCTGI